jgi:lipopolysaccharide transport system permease protein
VTTGAFALRRDLLWELTIRNVRLRYRGRALGLLWSQLGPIVSVLVYSMVFTRLIPLGIPDYPVFILIGVEAWQWFQGGLTAGTASVVANRDLVRYPGFRLAALPPLAVGTQLAFYILALPVIVGAVVVSTGRLPVTALWLPVLIAIQFVFCAGAAYLLAALHVFVRDTAEIVAVGLRLAFFLTPIIYDEARLTGSRFRFLFDLNPLAHLIGAQRDVLLSGRSPRFGALVIVAAVSVALAVVCMRVFRAVEHRFADEV